jgi:RNA-directed DNA polymerase
MGNDKWKFRENDVILLNHIDYSKPINLYVKVMGKLSPFSPEKQIYWAIRMTNYPGFNTRVKRLLTKQKGLCNLCKLTFWDDEIMEVDHITPLSIGGQDEYKNLQLLHRHCHDIKSALSSKANINKMSG